MDSKTLIDIVKDQLNRTLGFFSRVDGKASVVLAMDTAMLGVLAGNAPTFSQIRWYMAVAATVTVFLIGLSLWHVYKEAFPNVEGGGGSLIYFKEIAKRTESRFIDDFRNQSDEEYAKDMLAQVWRNSEILTEKFNHIRWALTFLALAIIPWSTALALFASVHQGTLFT